jgi:protoporphyrinogen/coproporphyrinogen III oxidase
LSDQQLIEIACDELRELIGMRGTVDCVEVARWPTSMPQYHVGHLERVAAIEARLVNLAGLALAGNAYHGVGIPQCIQSGEAAAERVVAELTRSPVTSNAN